MAIYLGGETAAVKASFDDMTPRQIVAELDKYVVGQDAAKKAVAIALPVSAFVAAGFEHSVANMYLISMGLLLKGTVRAVDGSALTFAGFATNLAPVILGNIVGGGVLVALVYHVIYRRGRAR